MPGSHQWVTFSKSRIHVTGCAKCGQILLPTNEASTCYPVALGDNPLQKRGYQITGPAPGTEEVA